MPPNSFQKGFPAIISPAGLAKIPGYSAKHPNKQATSTSKEVSARSGVPLMLISLLEHSRLLRLYCTASTAAYYAYPLLGGAQVYRSLEAKVFLLRYHGWLKGIDADSGSSAAFSAAPALDRSHSSTSKPYFRLAPVICRSQAGWCATAASVGSCQGPGRPHTKGQDQVLLLGQGALAFSFNFAFLLRLAAQVTQVGGAY